MTNSSIAVDKRSSIDRRVDTLLSEQSNRSSRLKFILAVADQ
ncbi:hypothetical protein [Rhodopirellula bahusiensis]